MKPGPASVLSMTGYGRAQAEHGDLRLDVEIRTVNNRFFKLSTRAADVFLPRAGDLENLIRERVQRGSVFLVVRVEPRGEAAARLIDAGLARRYLAQLQALQTELELPGDIRMGDLMALPGVVLASEEAGIDLDDVWPLLRQVVERALAELVDMRAIEGRALAEDIRARAQQIRGELAAIRGRLPAALAEYQERLRQRLRLLLTKAGPTLGAASAPSEAASAPLKAASAPILQEDLAHEVALYAEKCDVSEELARLESHLEQMLASLAQGAGAGRKIEFLAQEMFREASTMASKSGDVELVRRTLSVKAEVDRIKEQTLNLE